MRRQFLLCTAVLLCLAAVGRAQVYGDANSLVDSWYRTYLGRAPDTGMSGWVGELNQGTPADRVLASILGSDEYYLRAGSTPQGFITQLYQQVLQRAPTPTELSYWVQRMYTTDRTTIADAILNQSPGTWVSTTTAVAPAVPVPGTVVTPPSVVVPPRADWHHWERDRHWDWAHHHDIHEYHRPEVRFHHEEHHEHR